MASKKAPAELQSWGRGRIQEAVDTKPALAKLVVPTTKGREIIWVRRLGVLEYYTALEDLAVEIEPGLKGKTRLELRQATDNLPVIDVGLMTIAMAAVDEGGDRLFESREEVAAVERAEPDAIGTLITELPKHAVPFGGTVRPTEESGTPDADSQGSGE
jgi:hypothetical protein